MTVVHLRIENPVTIALTNWIKYRPPTGGNQKAQARGEGEQIGFQMGLAEGLVAYAAGERIKAINELLVGMPDELQSEWRFVQGVYAHEVQAWLRQAKKDWLDGKWSDASDELWGANMTSDFTEKFIWTEEFYDAWFRTRKTAIKAGVMEPDPKLDAEWIQEEFMAMTRMADPLAKLKEKLEARDG